MTDQPTTHTVEFTHILDLDTIIRVSMDFARIKNGSLPPEQAMTALDTFHKVYEPMLRSYKDVPVVKEILDNYERVFKKNYPLTSRLPPK